MTSEKRAQKLHTRETLGVFHLPKTFGNFHGKVHRVKNVSHLTQVPLVYALVTKIQDGGTDITVNSLEQERMIILSCLELVIPS